MKKILSLIFVSLLLSGCFHDKTKVALENCADANFKNKYLYSENLHLFKDTPLIKNNKDELSKIRKENRSLEKEILNYANKNLKDSMFFSDVYFPKIVLWAIKGGGDTKELELDDYNFRFKSDETKKNEIRKFIGSKSFKFVKKTELEWKKYRSLNDLYTDEWNKLKVKVKIKSKGYAKKHKECEVEYNKIPNSFMTEWG